jgi:hypothetical protein
MRTTSSISDTVMRRVRTIHAVRLAAGPSAAFLLLVAGLWGIGREVWVAKVFENMPPVADIPAVIGFYASAFMGTDLAVQIFVLLVLAASVWLVAASVRNLPALARYA